MIDSSPMNEARYSVICDRTNNTPETIANGELHVEFAIQPVQTIHAAELTQYINEMLKTMDIDVDITRRIREERRKWLLPNELFEFEEE